ncbi:MAG: lactate racemase domain-containing protein [Chthoniobacteraceae bacterium]
MNPLPRLLRIRQNFSPTLPLDIASTIAAEFVNLRPTIHAGARIAVGVGSRGITHLPAIVGAVLEQIRAAGAHPFIIPAMGSHGGATPEGQREVLASYGITEAAMGVPIRASLEVRQVGTTAEGVPVVCSTEALAADGIVLINRIKPHTDFLGTLGSGLLKMCVIGLGKRAGATAMHLAATQFGYERIIRAMAGVLLQNAPVLGGVAILENQFHDTARLLVIPRAEMETAEDALLVEAHGLMPLLPFDEIDLLIVDRIGKNISGAGMDPNVINRSVHGYDSLPMRGDRPAPFIRRIFVRGLTPETHGNAIGIGMADATTARLVREMDPRVTSINSLTALTPQSAKIPIAFDTDREAIERVLASLPLPDWSSARIVHIADTLSLAEMEVSTALWGETSARPELTALSEPHELAFDTDGNLPPI